MVMALKHLSTVANDVVQRCALKLNTSVEELLKEFEGVWRDEDGGYSRKLVEYFCTKALADLCQNIELKITDGSYSRFSFDMMLAWEIPSYAEEESLKERAGKGNEDENISPKASTEHDDISLFYSDMMPLLVNNEPNVGEDAFLWLGSLVPLVADRVNARFTFETLTAPTGNRLHFPAYDKFLKEIDRCIKYLQKQKRPTGVELVDDEFILHVEGTASSQRVVRHIGGTSWPGRLTLTNYALYFEASGTITYEDALKIDLSKNIEKSLKPASTGPWGAPLFDKAIVYESPELSEGIVLEFPEMTSSTRRDHWLALTREVMLMHQFLSNFNVESPLQAWEMQARTILGIIRLHAAREMLRILPPAPTKFLIFSLFDELPKGDHVLNELAESLKKVTTGNPCSASSILRTLNIESMMSSVELIENKEKSTAHLEDNNASLETAINEAREEEKEIAVAKATTECLREEGIGDSTLVLMELLKPLGNVAPPFRKVLMWERPLTTLAVIAAALIITYMEWVGKTVAAFLFWVVAKMIKARKERINEKYNKVVVSTASDSSTMESIVSAQHGLQTLHEMIQMANISLLKLWSVYVSKGRKQADLVMMGTCGIAIVLAVVPSKFIIMGIILYSFFTTLKLGKQKGSSSQGGGGGGDRRLKEWWDSIPVIPVRVVDNEVAGTSSTEETMPPADHPGFDETSKETLLETK